MDPGKYITHPSPIHSSRLEGSNLFAGTLNSENLFTHLGVSHADELALLFPLPLFRFKITQADKDYGMSRDLVKLWTDFGKYE